MAEKEPITALILRDVLDGIEYFHGKDAVDEIAKFALAKNRARQSNLVMDELERLYGPFPTPQESGSE